MTDHPIEDGSNQFGGDADPSPPSTHKRSSLRTHPVLFIVLAVAIVVATDWVVWHDRDDRIISTVSPIAARMGGKLGWPFGHEYVVVIERPVTDTELEKLTILNHPPRGSIVIVMFQTCDMDADRLEEIRRVLNNCGVFLECDDENSQQPKQP